MLGENIKNLRRAKGLSQEELALKLNVVRQTVSKWEKGISVPDAEMLVAIADALETSVAELLGDGAHDNENTEYQKLAAKLELLTEQLLKQAERRRMILKVFFITIAALSLISIIFNFSIITPAPPTDITIIGGADGPTAIFVVGSLSRLILPIAALVIAAVGIYKTKRK